MTVTADDEIVQIQMERPHVVLLGAGASLAACPAGDRNGFKLPLMQDLVERLELGPILESQGIPYRGRNFEEVYSELFSKNEFSAARIELEHKIYAYFESLTLPGTPNLYDHLVLSLRKKDVIATFNWDPFLVQAYARNRRYFELPRLLFLHGNVAIGYCDRHDVKVIGSNGRCCRRCGAPLARSQLLYPIAEKNYTTDPFIAAQWRDVAREMKEAYMLTIFGYGAPKSDAAAIELLKQGWGSSDQRVMEEVEIINIQPEEEIRDQWDPFINSHHCSIFPDFYSSWLANHPRRTGEAFINQFLDAECVESNPIPRTTSVQELRPFFSKLTRYESEPESARL